MNSLAMMPTTRIERSEFEQLRDRWMVSSAALTRLMQDRADMILAMNLAFVTKPHPDGKGLFERAARYLERARRHPKRLLDDIDDINIEIDAAKPEHAELEAAWQSACTVETNRLAEPLVPRHRAAVRRMAVAMQDLSVALADEHAIRRELASIAPMPESALLPNMTQGLGGLRQSDPASLGARWAATARKLGLLDD